jgi:hypothetical protein
LSPTTHAPEAPSFELAAVRWLARLGEERNATLPEIRLAANALMRYGQTSLRHAGYQWSARGVLMGFATVTKIDADGVDFDAEYIADTADEG